MSASPIARQANSHAQLIPSMRRVMITEPSQMPDVYSSTPNGTIYSTTPGGKNCFEYFPLPRWKLKKKNVLVSNTMNWAILGIIKNSSAQKARQILWSSSELGRLEFENLFFYNIFDFSEKKVVCHMVQEDKKCWNFRALLSSKNKFVLLLC